jgi:hypothetical protein
LTTPTPGSAVPKGRRTGSVGASRWQRRARSPAVNDATDVLVREELDRGHDTRVELCESVYRVLIATHRAEQVRKLRWRRFEGGELAGEFVHRECLPVAGRLVVVHRGLERPYTGQGIVQGGGAEFGVTKGVLNALGGNEISVVPGVSDQHPARSVRLPEVIMHRSAEEP